MSIVGLTRKLGGVRLKKEPKHLDIISERLYDRESEDWGKFKVIEFDGFKGKSQVEYYKVKFKDSRNITSIPIKTILENRVVDIDEQKKNTKKKVRSKKKTIKKNRFEYKSCVTIKGTSRLLSLDVSSKCTGWSVFIDGKLKKYGYIYQSTDKKVTERLNGMKVEIEKLLKQHKINCVCIEDVISLHKRALIVLSKIQGILLDMFYEREIPVGVVSVASWKAGVDINQNSEYKGKNSREQTKLKAVEIANNEFNLKLEDEFTWETPDDLKEPVYYDVADSLCLGKYFLENNLNKD